MTENEKRISLIKKIIQFDSDIDQSMQELSQLKWDYSDQPALLDKQKLQAIIKRYINGELDTNDVFKWADFLELRDDVDFTENGRDKISEIMHILANPDLEGRLTTERAKEFIALLM